MAAQAQVLREYLISLGYKINTQQSKEFDNHLNVVDGMMLGIGEKLVDAGIRMGQFVNKSAESAIAMDALAQRTRTPVSQLKALSYAASQLGLDSDALTGAVVNLADKLQNTHGFDQWLKSLGVKVDGQTPAQMLTSMLQVVQGLDPALQSRLWQEIGADPAAMKLFGNHLGEVTDLLQKFGDENGKLGSNLDEQNAKLKVYGQSWRELESTLERIGTKGAANLAPFFQSVTGWLSKTIQDTADKAEHGDAKGAHSLGGFLHWMFSGRDWMAGAGAKAAPLFHAAAATKRSSAHALAPGTAGGAPSTGDDKAAKMAALEEKYGLPRGLLRGVRGAESANGKHTLSAAGAKGDFQLMDPTARAYGVKDAFNFDQAADGAAHYLHDLLGKYHNATQALQAYNIGETQMNAYLRGTRLLPKETQDYPGRVAANGGPAPVQQTNTVHIAVHSTADPQAVAEAVGTQQTRVHQDQVRNMGALVR